MLRDALNGYRGQGLVEYAMIILLVALAALAAMTTLGTTLSSFLAKGVAAFPP